MAADIHLPPSPNRQPGKTPSGHTIAIDNFDGGPPTVIEADEFRACVPTRDCIQFWITLGACLFCMIFSVIMMAIQGQGPLFYLWEALLCTALGVLIPSPNYKTAFKAPAAS